MGGHDHGHHHHESPIPKVPDHTIYKIEDSPQMSKTAKRLTAHGLKDPWARNHVWRCHLNKHGSWLQNTVLLDLCTRGWKIWVPLLIGTIAIENYLGIDYHPHNHHNGHNGDHGHDAEH